MSKNNQAEYQRNRLTKTTTCKDRKIINKMPGFPQARISHFVRKFAAYLIGIRYKNVTLSKNTKLMLATFKLKSDVDPCKFDIDRFES